MVTCSLHWDGPPFLCLPYSQWSKKQFTAIGIENLPDIKTITTNVLIVHDASIKDELLHRFSSYNRMQRSIGYALRFIYTKQPQVTGTLTFNERNHGMLFAIRMTQREHFYELLKQLIKSSSVITPSSLAQLASFLGPSGLICVGDRLQHSFLNKEAKHIDN